MGDWVWYLGAGVLGVGGVWLFVWAWWGDRARGRARCGRCWYSLDTLMGGGGGVLPACPECGWRGKRHGAYVRTRRRRVWAVVALLIAMGAVVCGATPRAKRDGVWSVVPTWVMWGVVRVGGGSVPGDPFTVELAQRAGGREEFAAAAGRVYRWAPSVRLSRDRGVKGVPLRGLNSSILGRSYITAGFTFTPDGYLLNDADVDSVQSHENWWTPGTHVLRPSETASGPVGVLVTRVMCQTRTSDPYNRLSYFEWSIPLMESINDVMTPVTIEREKLAAALKPSVFVLPTTRCLALSVSDVSEAEVGGLAALGMKVEVVRRGEVIGRGRWYQTAGEKSVSGRPVLVRFGPYDPVRNVNGPMTSTLEELVADGCVARFSTDEEMALAALKCDKYWRGSFEVPLKELVK